MLPSDSSRFSPTPYVLSTPGSSPNNGASNGFQLTESSEKVVNSFRDIHATMSVDMSYQISHYY